MIAHTPRETFDRSLQVLMEDVLVLGNMAEQSVTASVEALRQRSLEASRRIYDDDQKINEKRYAIENAVIVLIATQQPMARDLRLLAAILEIINELERIADYAKGISKINMQIPREQSVKQVVEIPRMAELATEMLHRALVAFVNRDVEAARVIPGDDDAVDHLYNQVYRGMINQVIITPEKIDWANHLSWAAHNLERMADRVTNICERIVFAETGQMMELDQPDSLIYPETKRGSCE